MMALVGACAGGPGEAQSPAGSPAASGAFPVTIEHALGTTVIDAAPQRVVALGYVDQDPILALGVVPVAIREFTGNRPSATWPWAADRLAGQQPPVLPSAEISVEAIAALDPDLIVATSAGLTAEQYDDLAALAPVITQPPGTQSFQVPWQDTTRLIGAALGRSDVADQLVADLEGRFAQTRARYPQLAGRRAAVAAAGSSSGPGANFYVWSSRDPRSRVLTDLGMQVPTVFDDLSGTNFYADISIERLDLLDENDAVVWFPFPGAQPAALTDQIGYSALRVGQEGRVVNLTEEQGTALSFGTVLSLPTVLDPVAEGLAAAVRE